MASSLGQIVTLEEVKAHPFLRKMQGNANVNEYDEEYLVQSILSFTDRAERTCQRKFKQGTYTEVLSPRLGQRSIQVKAPPIALITSIKENYTGDFTGAAMNADLYSAIDGGASGVIKLRDFEFLPGVGALQVVYIGGFAPIPNDLKLACINQVAFEFGAARQGHLESEGVQGGSSRYRPLDLQPGVMRVLAEYAIRRVV